jgi:hypothetical protein
LPLNVFVGHGVGDVQTIFGRAEPSFLFHSSTREILWGNLCGTIGASRRFIFILAWLQEIRIDGITAATAV